MSDKEFENLKRIARERQTHLAQDAQRILFDAGLRDQEGQIPAKYKDS